MTKRRWNKPLWIIYDARGHLDTDRATVLVSCESLAEVREYKCDFPDDSAVYAYNKDGNETDYLGNLGDIQETK